MKFINELLIDRVFYHAARAGILMPRPVEVYPGQRLYRVTRQVYLDSDINRTVDSPWWWEFEAWQQMKHFAARFGYSESYSVRLHGALAFKFNETADAYVIAEALESLKAYKGRGKRMDAKVLDSQHKEDVAGWTPMQTVNEVYQLYVPGMTCKDAGVTPADSLAPQVFKVVGSGSLSTRA
jgi:hypothetical protein